MSEADPVMVTVNRDELLGLLDHVDSLVRWCSVSMDDTARYYRGGNAMWAIAHRLTGNDEMADELIRKLDASPMPT